MTSERCRLPLQRLLQLHGGNTAGEASSFVNYFHSKVELFRVLNSILNNTDYSCPHLSQIVKGNALVV